MLWKSQTKQLSKYEFTTDKIIEQINYGEKGKLRKE